MIARERRPSSRFRTVWLIFCSFVILGGLALVALGMLRLQSQVAELRTLHDPSLRRMSLLSGAHGGIALSLLGLLISLTCGWWLSSYRRSVLVGLAKQRHVRPTGLRFVVAVVLVCLGTFATSLMLSTRHGGWFFFAFTFVLLSFALFAFVTRLRVLSAAKRIIVATETSYLSNHAGRRREFKVHVDSSAPVVEGFRPNEHHALVQFAIKETYTNPTTSGKSSRSIREVERGVYPRHVPIVDASGRGVLDLQDCQIDVDDEPILHWQPESGRPPWFLGTFHRVDRMKTHNYYFVEWKVVDPGEPLLIYGSFERVAASNVGEPEPAAHPFGSDLPMVRCVPGNVAYAYVGDEETLLLRIRRETLVASIALGLAMAGGGAAMFGFVRVLGQS